MEWLILVGRILFGLIFFGSALGGHFAMNKDTTAYAEARGFKNASIAVYLTGVWILAAGLMVILGVWPDLGALMITTWALLAAVFVHHFWTDEGMMQTMEMKNFMKNFMKNLSIGGAGLVIFVFFATAGDQIGLQIGGPLFDLTL